MTIAKLTGGVALLMLFAVALAQPQIFPKVSSTSVGPCIEAIDGTGPRFSANNPLPSSEQPAQPFSNIPGGSGSLLGAVGGAGGSASISVLVASSSMKSGQGTTSVTWSATGVVPGSCTMNVSPAPASSGTDDPVSSWINTGKTIPASMNKFQAITVNGQIYIYGGYDGTNFKNTIYFSNLTDPTKWYTSSKTMPNKMSCFQLAAVGSYIYLYGGCNNGSVSNLIYRAPVSDPTNWSVVSGKTLPAAIERSELAIIGGYVYLFGGVLSSGPTNVIYRAPISDPTSWSNTGKTMPINIEKGRVGIVGNYVYIFGGSTDDANPINTILRAPLSDPTSWSVVSGKTLPVPLSNSALAVVGDSLYLFGGNAANGTSNFVTSEIYAASTTDPTTWYDTGKALPSAVDYSAIIVANNYLYLLGGVNSASYTNIIYRTPINGAFPFEGYAMEPWRTDGSANIADTQSLSQTTSFSLMCTDASTLAAVSGGASVWFPPSAPTVTITASDPTATESPITTGKFTVTRTANGSSACGFGSPIGGGQCRGYLFTSNASPWVVPGDWNSSNNSIQVIGAGGGGSAVGGGGGGGGFSSSTNVSLTPGASIAFAVGAGGSGGASGGSYPSCNVGAAGGDTYLCNSTSNCASLAGTAVVVGAQGGKGGSSGAPSTAAAGGAASSGKGATKFSGGNGGKGYGATAAGGGGAAGPRGNGGVGGDAIGGLGGSGAGGGGNGGGAAGNMPYNAYTGGDGGNNADGTGGGAHGGDTQAGGPGTSGGGGGGSGGSNVGGAGGAGTEFDSSHGSGGGGGAPGKLNNGMTTGSAGGLYGGGGSSGGASYNGPTCGTGGAGASGIIVITYTPSSGNLDISSALNVLFNIITGGNNAVRNTDYTLSGASISGTTGTTLTIPANAASVDVTVTPIQDSLYEGNEPVTMAVQSPGDSSYTVGTPSSDTVTITDQQSAASLPSSSLAACYGSAGTSCNLGVSPGRVRTGATATITWSVPSMVTGANGNNSDSCTVSRSPGGAGFPQSSPANATSWSNLAGVSSIITQTTTFKLVCTAPDGTTTTSASQTVDIVPSYQEI